MAGWAAYRVDYHVEMFCVWGLVAEYYLVVAEVLGGLDFGWGAYGADDAGCAEEAGGLA